MTSECTCWRRFGRAKSFTYSVCDVEACVHKGEFDGRAREKKRKRAVLGQSFGSPFKPEHSAGRFSKCQSHFWLQTDSLMDHSGGGVGVHACVGRRRKGKCIENVQKKCILMQLLRKKGCFGIFCHYLCPFVVTQLTSNSSTA